MKKLIGLFAVLLATSGCLFPQDANKYRVGVSEDGTEKVSVKIEFNGSDGGTSLENIDLVALNDHALGAKGTFEYKRDFVRYLKVEAIDQADNRYPLSCKLEDAGSNRVFCVFSIDAVDYGTRFCADGAFLKISALDENKLVTVNDDGSLPIIKTETIGEIRAKASSLAEGVGPVVVVYALYRATAAAFTSPEIVLSESMRGIVRTGAMVGGKTNTNVALADGLIRGTNLPIRQPISINEMNNVMKILNQDSEEGFNGRFHRSFCRDFRPPEIVCAEGEELVEGVCQPVAVAPVCEEGSELVDGICTVIGGVQTDETVEAGSEEVDVAGASGMIEAGMVSGGGCQLLTSSVPSGTSFDLIIAIAVIALVAFKGVYEAKRR